MPTSAWACALPLISVIHHVGQWVRVPCPRPRGRARCGCFQCCATPSNACGCHAHVRVGMRAAAAFGDTPRRPAGVGAMPTSAWACALARRLRKCPRKRGYGTPSLPEVLRIGRLNRGRVRVPCPRLRGHARWLRAYGDAHEDVGMAPGVPPRFSEARAVTLARSDCDAHVCVGMRAGPGRTDMPTKAWAWRPGSPASTRIGRLGTPRTAH
jgi:hypothetical protein